MNNLDISTHQKAFLAKAKKRNKPEIVDVEGLKIVVNPGVFPPATDTRLLVANIKITKGNRILDASTGSGAAAVAAGLQGASGLAIDINPKAVQNAIENFQRHKINMHTVESNLFANVPQEQFDYIFANGPFFEGEIVDPMDYACYGARTFIEELLSGIRTYLKRHGTLLIVMSAWSDLSHFKETAKKNRLLTNLKDTRKSDDGKRQYYLYAVSHS